MWLLEGLWLFLQQPFRLGLRIFGWKPNEKIGQEFTFALQKEGYKVFEVKDHGFSLIWWHHWRPKRYYRVTMENGDKIEFYFCPVCHKTLNMAEYDAALATLPPC